MKIQVMHSNSILEHLKTHHEKNLKSIISRGSSRPPNPLEVGDINEKPLTAGYF